MIHIKIVDGLKIRDQLIDEYKKELIEQKYRIKLVILHIGNDDASRIYTNNKKKICDTLNIECIIYHYNHVDEDELISIINKLNEDKTVTGIMVELPLPKGINNERVINSINSQKDVDGLTVNSIVNTCTVEAILEIFNYYNININSNKKIVMIGYSKLIGIPLEKYFYSNNIAITICNSKIKNLKKYTIDADIIITATGVHNLVTEDMIKKGAIIIDCSIIKYNNKLCGDVDFEYVKDKCSLITPVPKGVGPITTAMVIKNLIALCKNNAYKGK